MEMHQLIERKNQLGVRIQLKEARLNHQKRKEDTRRKILVGALMIDKYQKEGRWTELLAWLETKLERKLDRQLFGLSALSDKQ